MAKPVLHIGAHKTATTYLQSKLAMNEKVLAAADVVFLPLEILRKNFTGVLQDQSRLDFTLLADIKKAMSTKRVILSDENIAGMPGDLMRSGTFYPHIGERLQLICGHLDIREPEIYFSLREYSSFVVSMYCEFIRHSSYLEFEEYFAAFKASSFSWVGVIGDIVRSLPKAQIISWDYADFRSKEDVILSQMTGYDASRLLAPDKQVRPSFSDLTISTLKTLSHTLKPADLKKVLPHLARAFPKGPDYEAYMPVDAATIAAMKQRFQSDMAEIKRNFPSVRFL